MKDYRKVIMMMSFSGYSVLSVTGSFFVSRKDLADVAEDHAFQPEVVVRPVLGAELNQRVRRP